LNMILPLSSSILISLSNIEHGKEIKVQYIFGLAFKPGRVKP